MKKAQRNVAVLFDMDGLLIDSETILKRIWQNEEARLGFDLNDSNRGMRAAIVSGRRAIMIRELVASELQVRAGAAHMYTSLNHALDNREEWF